MLILFSHFSLEDCFKFFPWKSFCFYRLKPFHAMPQIYKVHDTLVAIVQQNVDMPKGICNECEEVIGAFCFVLAVTELLHQFNLTRLQGNESDGLFQVCRIFYVQHSKVALTAKEKIH